MSRGTRGGKKARMYRERKKASTCSAPPKNLTTTNEGISDSMTKLSDSINESIVKNRYHLLYSGQQVELINNPVNIEKNTHLIVPIMTP